MRIIRKGTAVGDLEIGKGQKYDLTEVSAEGITKQQIDGDRKKLNAIFNVFDKQFGSFDGVLDSRELANMVSVFNAIDKDRNNKLDNDELNALASILNERIPEGEEKVSGKDVKNFLLQILGAQKDDEKISVSELNTNKFEAPEIDINEDVQNIISGRIMGSDIKGLEPGQSDETVKKKQQEEEPQKLHSYTVQEGERYTDLIICSLKAQGVTDPTEQQIKEAKDNFEKNNPGAVKRTAKGYEYLLVGAKVQLEGELGDQNNAQEQINKYIREHVNNNGSGAVVKKPAADPAAAAAEDAGYRPTFSPDFFYAEKTKTHYKWNKEKNSFQEAPNVVYVDKDGSYTTKGIGIGIDDNHYKGVTFNQDGEIIRLDVRTDSNNRYTNKNYAAEKLGFRTTIASESFGIYYDEKNTKQHYKWNAEKYGFEPMDKNITWVGEDGATKANILDERGRKIGKVETKADGSTVETLYSVNGSPEIVREKNSDNFVTKEIITIIDTNNQTYLHKFVTTYGKNGSYISQEVDKNGNPIGEPEYFNNKEQKLTKEQYEALQEQQQ